MSAHDELVEQNLNGQAKRLEQRIMKLLAECDSPEGLQSVGKRLGGLNIEIDRDIPDFGPSPMMRPVVRNPKVAILNALARHYCDPNWEYRILESMSGEISITITRYLGKPDFD